MPILPSASATAPLPQSTRVARSPSRRMYTLQASSYRCRCGKILLSVAMIKPGVYGRVSSSQLVGPPRGARENDGLLLIVQVDRNEKNSSEFAENRLENQP